MQETSCLSAPPSPCWTQVQRGFFSCTINTGLNQCNNIITFNPSFTVKPFVGYEFNGTVAIPTIAQSFSTTITVPATLTFQSFNSTTWVNMPTTDTELYGQANQRLEWTVPATYGSQQAQVCADFTVSSGIPEVTAQFSTDQSTWNYLGDASFYAGNTGNPGFQCSPIEIPVLTPGTLYYFRAVGNDGFGPTNDAFGTIELFLSGNAGGTTTLSIPVTCATTSIAPTPLTKVTIFVQCGNSAIQASKTYTVSWWAGIPA
jgi:hypothetical protein